MKKIALFCLALICTVAVVSAFTQETQAQEENKPSKGAKKMPANPWIKLDWEPGFFTYFVYGSCALTTAATVYFAIVKQKDVPLELAYASAVMFFFSLFIALDKVYLEAHYFFLTGKFYNYLFTFFWPYRFILPISLEMVDYSKGEGQADRRKTLKLMCSFFSDFFVTLGLVGCVISYGGVDTYIFVVVLAIVLFLGYRWLTKAGDDLKRKVYRWIRERFVYLFPIFPVFSLVAELMAGVMPIGAYFNYYAALLAFFSQAWVIQKQVGKASY